MHISTTPLRRTGCKLVVEKIMHSYLVKSCIQLIFVFVVQMKHVINVYNAPRAFSENITSILHITWRKINTNWINDHHQLLNHPMNYISAKPWQY